MPLFILPHNPHPSILPTLFNQNIRQGTVIRRRKSFDDTGDERIKYHVILNKNSQEREILYFLVDSNPQYLLNDDFLKSFLVNVNTGTSDNIFNRNCYIDCTLIRKIDRNVLLSEFVANPHILIGVLPQNIIDEILENVKFAPMLEDEYKERIV